MIRSVIFPSLLIALAAMLFLPACESTGNGNGGGGSPAGSDPWAAAGSAWPPPGGGLAGPNTLRIINGNDFAIRVGLRSAGRGQDLVIRAAETATVTVPDGRYDLFFQYAAAPKGVYMGDPFTLQGNGYEIQILEAPKGAPGLRRIN